MKKSFLTCLLFCFFASQLSAQDRGDKIEGIKIAFLTEKLELDPKTAEKFWPVYHQYEAEMRTVLQESRKSDDNRSSDEILDQEQKAIDIRRKYSALFNKVISNNQLSQLYRSERDFNKMLIKRMKKREQRQDERMQGQPNDRMDMRPTPPLRRMEQRELRPRESRETTRPEPSTNLRRTR